MGKTLSYADINLLNKGLEKLGIRLSQHWGLECTNIIDCSFINNPDGNLRWLWPENSSEAAFLRFYHAGTFKSRLIAFILQVCIRFGLGRFVTSGNCRLYVNDEGAEAISGLRNWAIFTGTVGANRKIVAWYNNDKGSFFAKIPLSKVSEENIKNEFLALTQTNVADVQLPIATVANGSVLIQTDLYTNDKIKIAQSINDLPVASLVNWAQAGMELTILCTTDWWKSAKRKTESLWATKGKYIPLLVDRLRQAHHSIKQDELIVTAKAHGDFTPWNVRYKNNTLLPIDWEMYAENKPVLYDIFHFIYQDHILIKRLPYSAIRAEIDNYLSQPAWKKFIEETHIDVRLYERLYLIDTIAYYLDVYQRQDKWHCQVDWLLNTWFEALGHFVVTDGTISPRQALFQDMAHYLRNDKYAMLKLQENAAADLPSDTDVDICVKKKDAAKLVKYLREHTLVSSVKTTDRSFMTSISAVLNDGSFLHIDAIWKIKRKNIVFMDIENLLNTAILNNAGIKVASQNHNIVYVWLFHLLNNAPIPAKYVRLLNDAAANTLSGYALAPEFNASTTKEKLAVHDHNIRAQVYGKLKRYKENRSWLLACNTLLYCIDTIMSWMPKKGYVVTFSGVDGAGKSTVIGIVSKKIEKELRLPVVVLRHRPSILPILSAWKYGKKNAELRSLAKLPRTGTNKGQLSSYIRFTYYYLDYLLGQFYIQLRYVYRGYVVLYDRYYFDFINDSKRSNIIIPASFSRWLYKFILKPDFNYFLFAPSSVILQRKQELDAPTIDLLTDKYLALFDKLNQADTKHTYEAISNVNLDVTLNTIFSTIKMHGTCAR